MPTDFTTSRSRLVMTEWLEDDEGTPRSLDIVAPCDLTLERLRFAINAGLTSATILISLNGIIVMAMTGITESADTSFAKTLGDNGWTAAIRAKQGDVISLTLPGVSVDFHVCLEFLRAA